MDLTLLAVVAVLVVVAVSALSPKLGIAAPLSLVAAGVALSYAPGVPTIDIEPEVILAGVLPPLLYASAVDMPAMDFRRDLKSIGGLSVTGAPLDFLVRNFLLPFYPGAKIDEPFDLAGNVDRIVVTPAEALVYMRK